jgi:hypothetical protein
MTQIEVLYLGYEVTVDVSHYDAGRPAQTYGLPEDCYEAEPEEVEFDVVGLRIDCEETAIQSLGGWDDYDLGTAVIEKLREG